MKWFVILVFWVHGRETEAPLPGMAATQEACMARQHAWELRFNTSDPHAMYCRTVRR
jgi:hypothetical protein